LAISARDAPPVGATDGQLNAISANYNALIAKVERSFTGDLQFLGSYTYSKSMDIPDGDNTDIQNLYKPSLTYGPAGSDRIHNVLLSAIYELPFGPGKRFAQSKNIFNREFIGGRHISVIQQFATGQPISVTANNNAAPAPCVVSTPTGYAMTLHRPGILGSGSSTLRAMCSRQQVNMARRAAGRASLESTRQT
jgi:hypothetical protein